VWNAEGMCGQPNKLKGTECVNVVGNATNRNRDRVGRINVGQRGMWGRHCRDRERTTCRTVYECPTRVPWGGRGHHERATPAVGGKYPYSFNREFNDTITSKRQIHQTPLCGVNQTCGQIRQRNVTKCGREQSSSRCNLCGGGTRGAGGWERGSPPACGSNRTNVDNVGAQSNQ